MNDYPRRLLALGAAIACIVLAAVALIAHPADGATLLAWAAILAGSSVVVLAV